MKFYNRTSELKELCLIYSQSQNTARITVVTGRRRVEKTMLALAFAKGHKHLYFFVSKNLYRFNPSLMYKTCIRTTL